MDDCCSNLLGREVESLLQGKVCVPGQAFGEGGEDRCGLSLLPRAVFNIQGDALSSPQEEHHLGQASSFTITNCGSRTQHSAHGSSCSTSRHSGQLARSSSASLDV